MLLAVDGLRKSFDGGNGTVAALRGVDLHVGQGETVGLAGESGCGKSTLARCILRLTEPDSGSITFDGVDLLGLRGPELRRMRRRIQMVFQDARSLNPSFTVRRTVAEPLRLHGVRDADQLEDRLRQALERVHLPITFASRRPSQLSGGQKQRLGIARAIVLQPDLVVLDEPTSSLDQSVRARVIALLRDLQEQLNMSYLFLSHDLSTIRQICNRVYVMYGGRIVECGPTDAIYEDPRHPYTRTLIAAIPVPDPAKRRTGSRLPDERHRVDTERIGPLEEVSPGHLVATGFLS